MMSLYLCAFILVLPLLIDAAVIIEERRRYRRLAEEDRAKRESERLEGSGR